MPRIKLAVQSVYHFSHAHIVNVNDVNMGGHVGIPQLIAVLHVARREMLVYMGVDENNLGDNTALIIGDVVINLKSELHLDNILSIDSTVGEIGKKSFRFFHRVLCNGITAAIVEMGAVVIDKKTKKPVHISPFFIYQINSILYSTCHK